MVSIIFVIISFVFHNLFCSIPQNKPGCHKVLLYIHNLETQFISNCWYYNPTQMKNRASRVRCCTGPILIYSIAQLTLTQHTFNLCSIVFVFSIDISRITKPTPGMFVLICHGDSKYGHEIPKCCHFFTILRNFEHLVCPRLPHGKC